MPNIQNPNKGLRRYTTKEYKEAAMSCLWDGAERANKQINKMTNLEAMFFRGFWFDHDTQCYTNGKIRVSEFIIHEKDMWRILSGF